MKLLNKTKQKANLSITLLLLIGILLVVNFFSYQIFYRWDLTQHRIYSISQVSKKTVANLDDVVTIKAYFSDNLPSQFVTVHQEVADILDEYQNYANGKVRVEFINPGTDENTQRELAILGIPQLTFQVLQKDQMQLVNGYMGIAISFGDKNEVIPAVKQDTEDLEYQITTAIKKVTSENIAAVGFVTSFGTADVKSVISAAYKGLAELYTVQDVDLANVKEIPTDIKTLIIVGPREKIPDEKLKVINSFVGRGGNLIALLDGVLIEQGLSTKKNETGLENLLANYGLKVNSDLVADVRNGVASFTQGFFTFSSNYPFWPKITREGFNKDNNAVSSLENVIMPWASSIDAVTDKIDAKNITNLAQTTNQAWDEKDNYNIAPNNIAAGSERQQFTLAAMVNGEVKNPYPEKGQPEKFNVKMIVIGDSDFLSDGFASNVPDNLTLFQNLVDSVSLGDDLITIRSKGISSRPIKEGLSETTKAVIRYGNVFALTLVVIIFGLVRYFMRRRSRFVDEI